MHTNSPYHFSWRFLSSTFFIALLLFVGIRWDINPWLKGHLDKLIEQQHLDLHYAALERDGLHITLHRVQFKVPNLAHTIELDDVRISPAIMASLGGHISAYIHLQNDFMDIHTLISMGNQQLHFQDLNASFDVAQTQTWLALPSLVHAQGQLHLEGSVNVDMYSGLPQSGKITAHWQQAAASMLSQHYALGDYSLQANIENKKIQWKLTGGQELTLEGKGSVSMNTSAMPQWPLQATIKAQAAQRSPLTAFLTTSERHLKISGNIGHPSLQF